MSKIYGGRAHWALVKLLWQNVKQWINWCWEGRIDNAEVYGIKKIRRKTMRKGSAKYDIENDNKMKNELQLNIDEQ